MTYELRVRPRALVEIRAILQDHARLGYAASFLTELDHVFEALRAMPRRFPAVTGQVHRALIRRHPYAVFFRIRAVPIVVVLAVLHQRRDPQTWPR
jgi:plasmid stabilization system protein ParE